MLNVWSQNIYNINNLFILEKKALRMSDFWSRLHSLTLVVSKIVQDYKIAFQKWNKKNV